jgi:hypothetical protein
LSQSGPLNKSFSVFKIILAVLYFIGFLLHALDVMNLRLNFSDMDLIWKSWILFLLLFDLFASIGLFLKSLWGELLFILIAVAQLIAYIGFPSFFVEQEFLIYFHLICLSIYTALKIFDSRKQTSFEVVAPKNY